MPAAQAGAGEALAPPDCATVEEALLLDLNHNIYMIDLLFSVERVAS